MSIVLSWTPSKYSAQDSSSSCSYFKEEKAGAEFSCRVVATRLRTNSGSASGVSISSMYARKAVVYWYVAPMSSNERSQAAMRTKSAV